MKNNLGIITGMAILGLILELPARAESAGELRLVPFPKEIQLKVGVFSLDRPLVIELSGPRKVGELIAEELVRARLQAPEIRITGEDAHTLRLTPTESVGALSLSFRPEAGEEDYLLEITPEMVMLAGKGSAGLFHGAQSICQLIRANRRGSGIPTLTIRDWPVLPWRGFQDDITRGSSPKLETLERQVTLGAGFKMNLFSYYLEYQFAFEKHPLIGPKDGSLTAAELKALVAYAQEWNVNVLGSQQSLAHLDHILRLEPYKHLAETGWMISPAKEETYQLLDDLYSETVPLLPFPWFNLCCDEAGGFNQGPSKELAAQIGEGGVYARHIRRLHDLLKNKYGKRIMIWGDIIRNHPENLKEIPDDVIMLAWNYKDRMNFDPEILPFVESGHDFFVCPGVCGWSLIVPDFRDSTINIYHFVRDGIKHGALGMLNTSWDDDGENLAPLNWYGFAWGAECAWSGSTTQAEDFNRRIGAVLFGESGDHFGQAVALLSRLRGLPDMKRIANSRFWTPDIGPIKTNNREIMREQAELILAAVRPAIEHLEACRKEATFNADWLDYYLHAARRVELLGQRMLNGLATVTAYQKACQAQYPENEKQIAELHAMLRADRDAHEALGHEFERLWLQENKPYALDWTLARYRRMVKTYDALLEQLQTARAAAAEGKSLPAPNDLGLIFSD